MNASPIASHQGLRLLQCGAALLLLTSLFGFAIPYVAAPQLGLSVHKLAALDSVLLIALGVAWPRLNLGAAALRVALWLFLYGSFAILIASLLAAIWDAGHETMPLGAATARGTAFQESGSGWWHTHLVRPDSSPLH
jgi:(hydroxyamino)benzene mutase